MAYSLLAASTFVLCGCLLAWLKHLLSSQSPVLASFMSALSIAMHSRLHQGDAAKGAQYLDQGRELAAVLEQKLAPFAINGVCVSRLLGSRLASLVVPAPYRFRCVNVQASAPWRLTPAP